MSDMNRPRRKVGDRDPDFEANEKREKAKAARRKAEKLAEAKNAPPAAKPKKERIDPTGAGGRARLRAIDKVVDEALGNAKAETYY